MALETPRAGQETLRRSAKDQKTGAPLRLRPGYNVPGLPAREGIVARLRPVSESAFPGGCYRVESHEARDCPRGTRSRMVAGFRGAVAIGAGGDGAYGRL
jgi:hypothetical protein